MRGILLRKVILATVSIVILKTNRAITALGVPKKTKLWLATLSDPFGPQLSVLLADNCITLDVLPP